MFATKRKVKLQMKDELEADDPCGCNSGLTYGKCHQPIFMAPEGQMIKVAHENYARDWQGNAEAYRAQGLYASLAQELADIGGIERVLDVGCGLGHGLEAMSTILKCNDLNLIGIDENPDCLTGASARLDVPILESNIARMEDLVLTGGRYRSTPIQGGIASQGMITLVQSDVLVRDDIFDQWLASLGKLDAITLWFSGVHKARSSTEIATVFDIKSDADHRECVEDVVMQRAARLLRDRGALQIVVRGGFPDERVAVSETFQAYSPVGDDFRLKLQSVKPYRYEEAVGQNSIQVRSMDRNVDVLPNFAVSMIFKKLA